MTKVISTKIVFVDCWDSSEEKMLLKEERPVITGRGRKEKQSGDEMCFFLVDIEHRER